MENKNISIRITEEQLNEIRQKCNHQGISVSSYIKNCLQSHSALLDRSAIAKSLCILTTTVNKLESDLDDKTLTKEISKEVAKLWRALK